MRVLKPGTAVTALWPIVMVSTVLGQTTHPIESADSIALGVQADGKTDATAAIQKALDATGKYGGVVRLPAGKFLVAGSLKVPVGVALLGSNQAPVYIEPLVGTVILATGGWDKDGFVLARTDWEYVTNTFIFPVKIDSHFIATKNGAMNRQLCGIGADAANRCIVVDETWSAIHLCRPNEAPRSCLFA